MESRRKWIGLGLAAAVLMATVGSVAAASASDGQLTKPPPTVMLANNNADVSLSEGATTVISLQLTQGRYLLTANGLLYTEYTNAVGPLSFECQILVGTSQVAAMTSNGVSVQWTVALTGVAKVRSAGATAVFQCDNWQGDNGPAPPYVEANASLMAEKVNSVKVVSG